MLYSFKKFKKKLERKSAQAWTRGRERERERDRDREREGGREKENLKQALHSAQSLTQGSIP